MTGFRWTIIFKCLLCINWYSFIPQITRPGKLIILFPGFSLLPKIAFVVLVFGQTLDGGHKDVVVAQEVLEDELREGVAEARVLARILVVEKTKTLKK